MSVRVLVLGTVLDLVRGSEWEGGKLPVLISLAVNVVEGVARIDFVSDLIIVSERERLNEAVFRSDTVF